MGWTVEITPGALRDAQQIFAYLFRTHQDRFGHSTREANRLAVRRVQQIIEDAGRMANAPHIGTAHYDWRPGLRHLTLNRAIYWFILDEDHKRVRIVGLFFGGQDHFSQMIARLGLSGGAE